MIVTTACYVKMIGKQLGSEHIGYILGLYRDNRDNGQENGNYYISIGII